LATAALVRVLVGGEIGTHREFPVSCVRVGSHVACRAVFLNAHVNAVSDPADDELTIVSVTAITITILGVLLGVVLVNGEVGDPAGGLITSLRDILATVDLEAFVTSCILP